MNQLTVRPPERGGRWPSVKAEAVQKRLQSIERSNGGVLTPTDVVRDARDPASPLHDLFNWSVQEAAYHHWLDVARRLITSVKVLHRTSKTTVSAVYYVRDPSAEHKEQGYVSLPSVLSDGYMTRKAILSDLDRVDASLQRARRLAAMLEETQEIDALIDEVARVRERFRTQRISGRRRRAANG